MPERCRDSRRNEHDGNAAESGLPPKADMCTAPTNVRFVPEADLTHS